MAATEENYYRWLRERTTAEVIRLAVDAGVATINSVLPDSLEFSCQPDAPDASSPVPGTLAATAHAGDSHIWVSAPIPETAGQVTIGVIGSETHLIDPSMIQSQDGFARYAVWLETTLRRQWLIGTSITPG